MIRLSMTQISRFTSEIVPISQRVTGDGDESAARKVAADSPTMPSFPCIVCGFPSIRPTA